MRFKKMLSAILAGVMMIGSAAAVSAAGEVYVMQDVKAPATHVNGYYNGYFYNPIYDDVRLEAYWNPVTGKYNNCGCAYCTGVANLSGYYWVNGVLTSVNDYYAKYAAHTIKPDTTEVEVNKENVSEQTGVTYNQSKIPTGVIKRKPAAAASSSATTNNVTISETGKVYIQNPALLGGVNASITIPGKYYPADKVDIEAFFAKNSYSLYLYKGDVQTFGSGFKMISSDSSVARIVTDKDGQHLQAVGNGYAYIYLYTGGGVPFMRLYVNVTTKPYNAVQGYIDIEPASWKLDKSGDSTDVIVKADKQYTDIKLEVARGNGYIGKDGKLYATGDGAIVLKAYSAKTPAIQGYAIVYVGQYVNALYDGYWTNGNGCIIGSYWNPYLWTYDGYKIVGWVLTTGGVYVPVINKVDTPVKPNAKPNDKTTIVMTDLYDLLYGHCEGDVNTLYSLLWIYYNNNKPAQSFDSLYQQALKEIMEDIAAGYDKQIH
ncbi:MAG: hypothetical protein IKV57_04140 [Clostridia bacterium]|nr:hypothetical protein [Clostridia bacterium]